MNKKGFTLVELVLGLAIISVISLAMLTVISHNYNFLDRSREMSQDTFLSQQDIELEISSLKSQLKDPGHGLALETVTIDGVQVNYHKVNKDYHDVAYQYVVTPEQLPEYLLLKTFDVKASLKTDDNDAYGLYPIASSTIEGSNTHDPSTFSGYWMRDVRQWYVSRKGFNTPVPRGNGADSTFKYYDYLVGENLESDIGEMYPLFPDDYILLGAEVDASLGDLTAYGGQHIVYRVTPAAKSGKLGLAEVSEPVYISGLTTVDDMVLHLDASYLDPSNETHVTHGGKVIKWSDLASGIEVNGISEYGQSTNSGQRPSLEKNSDFSGRYVHYTDSLSTIINNQNTSGKYLYVYGVAKGDEGESLLVNGSQAMSRSSGDEVLMDDWYLIKSQYLSASNSFVIGQSDIEVAELIVYAYDAQLSSEDEATLYASVGAYIKGKFSVDDVDGDVVEIYPITRTVKVGDLLSPPTTMVGRYSTGLDNPVSVVWNDASNIDTTRPATVIRNGHAKSDSSITTQMTVVVKDYSMDIVEAKFISQSIVEVTFSDAIKDQIDKDAIEINGDSSLVTYAERPSYDDHQVLVFLKPNNLSYREGMTTSEITFNKGSVKHTTKLDVLVNTGQAYALSGTSSLVYEDAFDAFDGWDQYRSGSIRLTDDPLPRVNQVMEKINNNDSHGGYRRISGFTEPTFIFEGWIHRPSDYTGGAQDRLAISEISNSKNQSDGYGFGVSGSTVFIEKRQGTGASKISDSITYKRVNDQWYKFVFKRNEDFSIDLYLFDSNGLYETKVTSNVKDNAFSSFDSIMIHGGQNFYLDDFRLFTY